MEFVKESRLFDIVSGSSCMSEVKFLTGAENILFTTFRPIMRHSVLYLMGLGDPTLGLRNRPLTSVQYPD